MPTVTGNLYRGGDTAELGFDPKYYSVTVEYKYDPDTAPNTIIEQKPEGGLTKKVVANTQRVAVTLTVSRGAETVTLGDYTIREARGVEAALRSMGFVVKTESVYSDVVQAGYVASTMPAPGSVVNIGDTVLLYVSRGESIKYILAPDFKGLSEVEAAAELKKSGLTLGTVTYKTSNRPAGTVLEQSITPYEQVPQKATTVDFVVSGGPTYGILAMPDLTGMNLEQAKLTLSAYDLTLVIAGQTRSDVAVGLIVEQDPPLNTDLRDGTYKTVSVKISAGPDYRSPDAEETTSPDAETTSPEEDITIPPEETTSPAEETTTPVPFPIPIN